MILVGEKGLETVANSIKWFIPLVWLLVVSVHISVVFVKVLEISEHFVDLSLTIFKAITIFNNFANILPLSEFIWIREFS